MMSQTGESCQRVREAMQESQAFASNMGRQVREAAAIGPLIIVPDQRSDHVAVDHHCAQGVENTTGRIALEVGADER